MVDAVEELLQVYVHHPAPAGGHIRLGLRHRLQRAATRTEPEAVPRKLRLEDGLQHLVQRLLDQAIQDRRDAQLTHPSAGLGDLHPPHRQRLVIACQQRLLDTRPMNAQVLAQGFHGHAVHARRPLVALHALQGQQHVLAGDHRFHQLRRLQAGSISRCRDLGCTHFRPLRVPPATP